MNNLKSICKVNSEPKMNKYLGLCVVVWRIWCINPNNVGQTTSGSQANGLIFVLKDGGLQQIPGNIFEFSEPFGFGLLLWFVSSWLGVSLQQKLIHILSVKRENRSLNIPLIVVPVLLPEVLWYRENLPREAFDQLASSCQPFETRV